MSESAVVLAYADDETPSTVLVVVPGEFSALRVGGTWAPAPSITFGELDEGWTRLPAPEAEALANEARTSAMDAPVRAK